MKCFVTGGAGFIGSHIVDRLIANGDSVVVYDNLTTGSYDNIKKHEHSSQFTFLNDDVLHIDQLQKTMKGCDRVFHFSANADVRHGLEAPDKDVIQNTLATWHVLEAMRKNNIKEIVFPSTGSIYGEPAIFPTPENAPFPLQTSLYGASKLACEGLIEAYCEGYGFKTWIFRFVSILGERYSHGCIRDFYHKLKADPTSLSIIGNGKQNKSYLYVGDCVDAIMIAIEKSQGKINIYNLGTKETIKVDEIAAIVIDEMGIPKVTIKHTGGKRGWIGDSPYIFLDISKIQQLGWSPRFTIREAIIRTMHYINNNK